MRRLASRALDGGTLSDLRGVSRLVVGAVAGATDIVEDMHRNIMRISPIVGAAPAGRTRGITGLVYRSVRGVTNAVGFGLDAAMGQVEPLLRDSRLRSPRREALVAALNGVMGDHLAASENPLAIRMHLRQRGGPVVLDRNVLAASGEAGSRVLLLVHGLCMSDEWTRGGHDHGALLAQELGYTPIYLRYNSGRNISTNGREFAAILDRLVQEWPVPITDLAIVGHSMGGLISRSAHHYGVQAGHAWPHLLDKLVFVGTPHHGAPLERVGNRFNLLLGISPYTAPLTRLGRIRSAGVTDLRFSNLLDEDWRVGCADRTHDSRQPLPLPEDVRCYAIAATLQSEIEARGSGLPGDGLVPVPSALGQHEEDARALRIPSARQSIFYGLSHLDLLRSRAVFDQIHSWLAEA